LQEQHIRLISDLQREITGFREEVGRLRADIQVSRLPTAAAAAAVSPGFLQLQPVAASASAAGPCAQRGGDHASVLRGHKRKEPTRAIGSDHIADDDYDDDVDNAPQQSSSRRRKRPSASDSSSTPTRRLSGDAASPARAASPEENKEEKDVAVPTTWVRCAFVCATQPVPVTVPQPIFVQEELLSQPHIQAAWSATALNGKAHGDRKNAPLVLQAVAAEVCKQWLTRGELTDKCSFTPNCYTQPHAKI